MELIIKIPDEAYEQLKSKPTLDNIAESIIANGTPYNPTGDCISRELLKKDIEAQISDFNELNKKGEPYKEFKDIRAILFGLVIGKNLIDNAPPVEMNALPKIHYDRGFNAGYDSGKNARPKGECENCVFHKFTETFIDGVVAVMNKNGIISVEQLQEMLKGDDNPPMEYFENGGI